MPLGLDRIVCRKLETQKTLYNVRVGICKPISPHEVGYPSKMYCVYLISVQHAVSQHYPLLARTGLVGAPSFGSHYRGCLVLKIAFCKKVPLMISR